MKAKVKEVEKIILGIDPGTSIMGYGVISVLKGEIKLLALGVIHLAKLGDHSIRLQRIYERTVSLIDEFKVDEMAIEAPFYGKNAQSMLKLGRAQGVAMAASISREVTATEYAPKKIKKAVTGKGAASKEQVAAMVKSIVKYKNDPKYLDATDALAVAVCHHFQGNVSVSNQKSYSGWDSFLKNNPDRKA
ncbi:MAG: crossover junction endodeoxyribonuclease RuvC [Vicingaceae bacterium]|jgi:crossover junction endodeoxyribonuclease RuvC